MQPLLRIHPGNRRAVHPVLCRTSAAGLNGSMFRASKSNALISHGKISDGEEEVAPV
jgi:hypothetical protein